MSSNLAISKPAKNWLNFFKSNPDVRINYRTLMENGVSRRKSLAILKELRDAEHIEIVKLVGGGTNVKLVTSDMPRVVTSDVTSLDTSGIAEAAVQLLQLISNSSNARTADIATNKFFDEVKEEEKQVGYDFFGSTSSEDDEFASERAKHLRLVKQEHAEAKLAQAEKRRDRHRSNLDPTLWSCKDVAYEFADRMADIWSIAPFSVTQSRFVQALAAFRKQHDTNGALETKLIDLFFASLEAEKYTDGNHLWRAFMYKAPMLLQTAKELTVTVEERETNIIKDAELTSKKLSLFDEDDNV
jgi:hypothetical protein